MALVERPPQRPAPGVARTKIQPPRLRADAIVDRPALESALRAVLPGPPELRLVLLSAAAGYGKTTALARALAEPPAGTAVVWLAADEGDDLHHLLGALLAALEPLDLPWRTAPEALLAQAGEPATRPRVVAELVNALDAAGVERGVIVLDDLHRIDDGACHDFLDRMLERLGPGWTLAIATRQDPPLPLARLRARGELVEFRADALRFGEAEALTLAARAGVPEAPARAMQQRTQGWPAGLRLALARGSAPPSAGEREMADFLAAEVIDRLEPGLRGFLLRSSVLPVLTPSRAAAVTGEAGTLQRLHEIERLGLFATVVDAATPALKLHDLFRDALLARLQREHTGETPALWRRAAAGEPDPVRRVAMLQRAGDEAAAAEALLEAAAGLLAQGAQATIDHALDGFTGEALARRPALQTVLGLVAWRRRDFGTMLAAMQRAEGGFAAEGAADHARTALALQALALHALGRGDESAQRVDALRREPLGPRTRLLVLQAGLWHALDLGAHHRAPPLLDELVARLERNADPAVWHAACPTPELNGLPGTAPALWRWAEGALRIAGERPLPLRALAQVQRGWLLAWQAGDLAGAEAALGAAQDDSRWLGDPGDVMGAIRHFALHLHLLSGQRARALAMLQALADGAAAPATQGPAAAWAQAHDAARAAALLGERALAETLLARLEALPCTGRQQARLAVLRGHRARRAGDAAGAIAQWRQALDGEAALQRLGQGLELRLFLAAALAEAGHRGEAAALLPAVTQALVEGAGRGALGLAREALAALQSRGLALDLAPPGDAPEADPGPEPLRPGGLSERELEVLERIAAGDSNKLIARAFELSPHTVKRHVANILDKLGVDSRGQAAAWYRRQTGA